MSVWRLYVFGLEVIRVERDPQADKTLGDALSELMDPGNDLEQDVDCELGRDFINVGREAGDDEHLIFDTSAIAEYHEHVGEEDLEDDDDEDLQ